MPTTFLRDACCAAIIAAGWTSYACAQTPAAAADEAPRFDVLEYVVEGNSVLPVTTIEQTLTPFMGPGRTMNDVESARAALEKVYQSSGYLSVFVDVPEQRVGADGSVVLQVIEGRIDRLSVTGSRYFSQGYIRSKVDQFAEGRVPNFNEAQRQLALVNRSEERRVQPVLRTGRLPGTVEVELKVSDALPFEGSVEINNQHAADTRPLRLAASLRYDNLFQRDHSIALNLQTAPQDPSQSKVLVANYAVPLDSGASVSGYLLWSDSSVDTLGGITALGKGTTLGLRYAIPLMSSNGAHSVTFGVDYKDLKQRLVASDAGTLATTSTPLRYLPLQMAYSGSWSGTSSQTQLSGTFIAALRRVLQRSVPDCPRLDGSFGPADQFACNHNGADGGFGLLRLDLRHTERFGGHQFMVRLATQLAQQPLVSGEQFTVGGADTVRGYLESSAAGDHGLLGSLQWRSPGFGAWWRGPADAAADAPWWADASAIAFLDVARVSVLEPAAGQQARIPLLGSGIGLRLEGRGRVSGGIDVAWPHKATFNQPAGAARVHARLALRF